MSHGQTVVWHSILDVVCMVVRREKREENFKAMVLVCEMRTNTNTSVTRKNGTDVRSVLAIHRSIVSFPDS